MKKLIISNTILLLVFVAITIFLTLFASHTVQQARNTRQELHNTNSYVESLIATKEQLVQLQDEKETLKSSFMSAEQLLSTLQQYATEAQVTVSASGPAQQGAATQEYVQQISVQAPSDSALHAFLKKIETGPPMLGIKNITWELTNGTEGLSSATIDIVSFSP